MTPLDHARELVRLLEAGASTEGEKPAPSRMGVQIDAEGMAELVELAAHLRMTPALTLKLALRALTVELGKRTSKGPGWMVGKERGLLEGKR